MSNHEVALSLYEIADLLEVKGEALFKVRAYRKAAEAIEQLPDDIRAVVARRALLSVSGIGQSIAAKVEELVQTGRLAYLEDLRQCLPPGIVALTALPGLGAKVAQQLFVRLGIDSLDRLETAARQGGLRELPGMTPRKEAELLAVLERRKARGDARQPAACAPVAEALLAYLRRHPVVEQAESAGAHLRGLGEVDETHLIAATEQADALFDQVIRLPFAGQVLERAPERLRLMTGLGRVILVSAVPRTRYDLTLLDHRSADGHAAQLGAPTDGPNDTLTELL